MARSSQSSNDDEGELSNKDKDGNKKEVVRSVKKMTLTKFRNTELSLDDTNAWIVTGREEFDSAHSIRGYTLTVPCT